MGRRVSVYRRVGDVYVKVGEADEQNFDWLKDESDMEIVSVYIDELEEDHTVEERKMYEFYVEL